MEPTAKPVPLVGAPPPVADPGDAAVLDRVIAARRTSLLIDPDSPVAVADVEALIAAATWAPNHKRTWPWRFTVISDGARDRFGAALAAAAEAAGAAPAAVEKVRGKYRRSPVVVLVWCRASEDPHRHAEDRDAVAAATQNLLLAATARGLASQWASLGEALVPAASEFADVDDDDLVALVYLGWPTGQVAVPPRPDPKVRWLHG